MTQVHDLQLQNVAEAVEAIGRRQFLKISSIAAAVAASGVASIAPNIVQASVPEGVNHMNADQYAIWHRLMQVLLPTKGSALVDPETLPVLQTVDGAFLATMPPAVLSGLMGGLAFFNDAAKEHFGKPFITLSDADAAAYCDALAASEDEGARGLFTALKFLTVTAYWALPPTWEPTGFQGPVTAEWGLDYAGNRPLPSA